MRVVGVDLGHRKDPDLGRCQPCREGARVVLDQHAEEALDRTHQRPMDHHGSLALAIAGDVLEIETFGQVEVELDGRQLPRPADGVLDVDVDLRAVERAAALVGDVVEPAAIKRGSKTFGGLVPQLVLTTDFSGGRVESFAWKSSKPNARNTESTKSSNDISSLWMSSRVVKIWLSSWVKPRLRIKPCTAPDNS